MPRAYIDGPICSGVSLDPFAPVPSRPASSCPASPRSPMGRHPAGLAA